MSMHVHPRMTEVGAMAAALSIIPELQKHAAKAEELRYIPKQCADLLMQKGLLQTPAACGGHEISMRAHVEVLSNVAYGCGATAWVLGVWQAHSWMFGHANTQMQQDVFADGGNHPVSAVIGPRGRATRRADGTFSLSGFWPFASGNIHAEWLLLGTQVFDEAGNKIDDGDLLVPRKDLDIVDDWHVAGLQGTGSSSVKCKDLKFRRTGSFRSQPCSQTRPRPIQTRTRRLFSNPRPVPCLACASHQAPQALPVLRWMSS